MRQIEIYDTTLRDGAQSEGINYSVSDKLKIIKKLDKLGVHYIEAGWVTPLNAVSMASSPPAIKNKPSGMGIDAFT